MLFRVASLVLILVISFVAKGAPTIQAASPSWREYQIRAAFLYNFAKFVEWPAEVFRDSNSTLVLGVLGENPFGPALESIRGKTVRGRTLAIRKFESLRDLDHCHILFTASSEPSEGK